MMVLFCIKKYFYDPDIAKYFLIPYIHNLIFGYYSTNIIFINFKSIKNPLKSSKNCSLYF